MISVIFADTLFTIFYSSDSLHEVRQRKEKYATTNGEEVDCFSQCNPSIVFALGVPNVADIQIDNCFLIPFVVEVQIKIGVSACAAREYTTEIAGTGNINIFPSQIKGEFKIPTFT